METTTQDFGADFNDLFGTNYDGEEEAAAFMPQQTDDFVPQLAPETEEILNAAEPKDAQIFPWEKPALVENPSEPPPMEAIPPNEAKTDIMAELFGAEDGEDEGATMQDLFGEDVEDEEFPEEPSAMSVLEAASSAKPPQKRKVFRRICPEGEKLDIKIHPSNRPEGDAIIVRMPNIVSLEAENFDASNYTPPKSSENSSFVRWRIVFDAKDPTQPYKESNSRLVTWSDGSKSIVVGSEYFDVQEAPFKAGEHFLFSASVSAQDEDPGLSLGHGSIRSKYLIKATTGGGVHGEISQAAIASQFLRSNKAHQMTVGQKVAMLRDDRAKRRMADANSRANRKRKRVNQRQERAKQRKMTEEFLETGATEINPDDMGDTDEEDYSNQGASVQAKLTNLVGSNMEPASDSEDEEITQQFRARKKNPNSKIIDDSDDSD